MTDKQLLAEIRHELKINTLGSYSWLEGEEFLHDKIQANNNAEISATQWNRATDLLIEAGDLHV